MDIGGRGAGALLADNWTIAGSTPQLSSILACGENLRTSNLVVPVYKAMETEDSPHNLLKKTWSRLPKTVMVLHKNHHGSTLLSFWGAKLYSYRLKKQNKLRTQFWNETKTSQILKTSKLRLETNLGIVFIDWNLDWSINYVCYQYFFYLNWTFSSLVTIFSTQVMLCNVT